MFDPPFRWDLTNKTHLGSLVKGDKAQAYQDYLDQLLACCSRVLAFSRNSDLIFVGRSPESIFDHLSGFLFDTSWFDRLGLLQFSMRCENEADIKQRYPNAIAAMRDYLRLLALDPPTLLTRVRPNVSIPQDLWRYLGDYQLKVTRSFTPARWPHSDSAPTIYSEEQLKALRHANYLFEYGTTRERRVERATYMAREPAMKFKWFRDLVLEIRP